jgi:hypothetical protein
LPLSLFYDIWYNNTRNNTAKATQRWPVSKLATMMAVIFICCGLSHIIHVAAFHTGSNVFASKLTSSLYLLVNHRCCYCCSRSDLSIIKKELCIVIDEPNALFEDKDKLQIRNEQVRDKQDNGYYR